MFFTSYPFSSRVSFRRFSSGSVAVVIVSASAYGENAIFKESMDLASPEAASVDAFFRGCFGRKRRWFL